MVITVALLFLFFIGLPVASCSLILLIRRQLTCMVGMMSAMTVGMISGLGIGSSVAALSSLDMYHSTIIGMLSGALLGALTGIPISLMAVLDGVLSGVMAGMMGAMFAGMIPPEQHLSLLRILCVLAGSILFILHLMILGELNQELRYKMPLAFRAPVWVFLVVALGGMGLSYMELPNVHIGHEHQKNTIQPRSISIMANEFAYTPNHIQIRSNEQIQVTLQNTGAIEHDFIVQGTDIHIHIQPGEQSSNILQLTRPGLYQAYCSIPGHREAGMTFQLEVT